MLYKRAMSGKNCADRFPSLAVQVYIVLEHNK